MRPLVLVPTYNERDNLPTLVEALLRIDGLRVLVVDDGSQDGTADAAEALAASYPDRVDVIRRSGARGLGLSYVDAIRAALRTDATHVCQMDADLSHDPADVPRLLAASAAADYVIGSRYVPGSALRDWARHRALLSAFANWYVRAITGLAVRDCTSGFRCCDRSLLERLPLERVGSAGYAFQVELTWLAREAGARIVELPITFSERRHGASKLSARVIVESVLLPWRLARRGASKVR